MNRCPKGPARLAVEAALQRGTIDNPIDPVQVAGIAGVHITVARTHIGTCINLGLAYNVNAGHRCSAAYVWGKRPVAHVERHTPTGHYAGEKPAARRPGALDFLDLPSLVHGECIERRRPILIGASQAALRI